MSKKDEEKGYNEGRYDAEHGKYKDRGVLGDINDAIHGVSDRDRGYNQGYKDGKSRK